MVNDPVIELWSNALLFYIGSSLMQFPSELGICFHVRSVRHCRMLSCLTCGSFIVLLDIPSV